MTICDNCSEAVEPTANYCPDCGSELHPPLKDWSDGFLSIVDRGHIQEAIDGNESPPERYHERMHETVRHALADFCLLDRWDSFDNTEALVGDFPEKDVEPDDMAEIEKVVRLTCPFRFMLNGLGIERSELVLEFALITYLQDPETSINDVSVTIEVDETDE